MMQRRMFLMTLVLAMATQCARGATPAAAAADSADSASDFEKLRAETLSNLRNLTFEKFVQDLRSRVGDALRNPLALPVNALQHFLSAVSSAIAITSNTAFTFVAKVFDEDVLWTPEQLARRMSGVISNATDRSQFESTRYNYSPIDYRALGQVSPVKDQGSCASCYAFGAVAAIESQHLRARGSLKVFSEQQVVDCTYKIYPPAPGSTSLLAAKMNQGCDSGTSPYVMRYFNEKTVQEAASYPYTGTKAASCRVSEQPSQLAVNYTEVTVDNEDHLAFLLEQNGPINVYIYAGSSFGRYGGGVYNDERGCRGRVNHSVLLVGLVVQKGKELWVVKNSWGSKWGEQGYILMPKGVNMCNMVSNPVIVARIDGQPIIRPAANATTTAA